MLKITRDDYEVKHKPLPWQVSGLQQTATGYGKKLATWHMIHYAGRWRRIYCMCYSNCGTLYIKVLGNTVIVQ